MEGQLRCYDNRDVSQVIVSAVIQQQGLSQYSIYRQFSNIRRTQSQNITVSRLVLQLSLPNPMKSGVKLRMKM